MNVQWSQIIGLNFRLWISSCAGCAKCAVYFVYAVLYKRNKIFLVQMKEERNDRAKDKENKLSGVTRMLQLGAAGVKQFLLNYDLNICCIDASVYFVE